MTTWLSDHFSLEEMTITSHREFENKPSPAIVLKLVHTAREMEKIRDLLGNVISINSAYRSALVNGAVGGSPTSQHTRGEAVDFICPRFGTPLQICRAILKSGISFDQMIEEGTWVHLSFKPTGNRRSVLTKDGKGYKIGLRS